MGCSVISEKEAEPISQWEIIGPGAGGGVFIPTISPFDTNLVLSKGDMTGNFISYNGGKSWKLFNLMTVAQDFEFDPADPNVVYAASRGYLYDEDRGSGLSLLYRSDNRGETWKVVYPDIHTMPSLEKIQSMSFLPSELVKGMPDGSIDMIRVDREDSRTLYLGLSPLRPYIGKIPAETPRHVFVMQTKDHGENWKQIATVQGTAVLGIFPHCLPDEPDAVLVITDERCATINQKTGSVTLLDPPAGKLLTAGSGEKDGITVVYLVADVYKDKAGALKGGVWSSKNGGKTWTEINPSFMKQQTARPLPVFRAVAVCENQPENAYLSVVHPAYGPNAVKEVRYEIYRTRNSGASWETVYSANSAEVLTRNFNDSWLNRNYGPGWGGDVLTLGVAPANPNICYATDFGQMYKTSDGGRNWNQVCSENHADSSVTSTGLDLTCCYGVVFDPFDKNHLIVSYIDIGLFHSFDGGKSWKQMMKGIPETWVNTCYDVAFDPAVQGRVWSTWADQHSLPRKSQFGNGRFQGHHGGVAVSNDGGRTWEKCSNGLPDNCIGTDLMLDPASNNHARTLFLSSLNQGVFTSTDGGRSWIKSTNGLDKNLYPWQVRLAGKRIYLLCVRGWQEEKVIDGKLYSSENGGNTWKVTPLPEGVNAPSDLLVDPADPAHMYLSCWPRHNGNRDVSGGVFETRDAGVHWHQCFDERIRVFAAAFDPSGSLYINTFQNAAYQSKDYGASWNRIPGYRFKWGHCPVPDPNHPGKMFLTTYGVSIYYGSASGNAEEFGRIENLPEAWW
jgi:photosystem II stability/assembly factor-like uncharacterized protein